MSHIDFSVLRALAHVYLKCAVGICAVTSTTPRCRITRVIAVAVQLCACDWFPTGAQGNCCAHKRENRRRLSQSATGSLHNESHTDLALSQLPTRRTVHSVTAWEPT